MYKLTFKIYNRRYDGDNSYHYDYLYCYDSQLGYWLSKPRKDYHKELISYEYIR